MAAPLLEFTELLRSEEYARARIFFSDVLIRTTPQPALDRIDYDLMRGIPFDLFEMYLELAGPDTDFDAEMIVKTAICCEPLSPIRHVIAVVRRFGHLRGMSEREAWAMTSSCLAEDKARRVLVLGRPSKNHTWGIMYGMRRGRYDIAKLICDKSEMKADPVKARDHLTDASLYSGWYLSPTTAPSYVSIYAQGPASLSNDEEMMQFMELHDMMADPQPLDSGTEDEIVHKMKKRGVFARLNDTFEHTPKEAVRRMLELGKF